MSAWPRIVSDRPYSSFPRRSVNASLEDEVVDGWSRWCRFERGEGLWKLGEGGVACGRNKG